MFFNVLSQLAKWPITEEDDINKITDDDDINKNRAKTANYEFSELVFNYTSILAICNIFLCVLQYYKVGMHSVIT
jgi:hypothetical protein